MTRGGRKSDRSDPERRCLVTGETHPKTAMIRFVVGPGAQVVPDIAGRLPGRGLWVSAQRAALERAVAKKMFARAARQPVELPAGLVDLVEAQLAQRVIELISLARKGGSAVCGYEKVRDWLTKGEAVLLLQASDGSERGKAKLRPPPGQEASAAILSAAELGLAFGREHVIHAALASGGLASRVVVEAARLAGIRRQVGGSAAGKE